MKSDEFKANHSLSENSRLIDFLSNRYPIGKKNEKTDLSWLKELTFIYNNHEVLSIPEALCFPNSQYSSEYSDDIDYIHETVFGSLSDKSIDWLSLLGTKEPSDVSIIETGKLFEEDFITEDNAIDVLLYLFDLHSKSILEESHYSSLRKIRLLTQKGSFEAASNCYLSDRYKPNLPIEKYVDVDFFVSSKYLDKKATASEWNVFLSKIGVSYDLVKTSFSIKTSEAESTKLVFSEYVKEAIRIARMYSWISYEGWTDTNAGYGFSISSIYFKGIPYLPFAKIHGFSKILWNNIFSTTTADKLLESTMWVNGATGIYCRTLGEGEISRKGLETNYIKWVLLSQQVIPGTDHSCHYAKDVFTNTIPNAVKIAGRYLPVIDTDVMLDASWANSFGFKTEFTLHDYLTILQKISNLTEVTQEDKERIVLIYSNLSSIVEVLTKSQKDELKIWALSNKILARDNQFYSPKELSIITIEGFLGNLFAFTGQGIPSDSLL